MLQVNLIRWYFHIRIRMSTIKIKWHINIINSYVNIMYFACIYRVQSYAIL